LQSCSLKRQALLFSTCPILLTGMAVCATCRCVMTLRTGRSKGGRVYRYYTCSNCATKGKTVCKGRSIAMQKLDTLVTEHLLERLFKPERIAVILASLSSRRAVQAAALNARITALQREMTDAEDKLKRLYRLVEDGLTDVDEVLKDRLNTLKADRDRAKAALERAKEHSATQIQIDPALIERFGRTMRENFSTGSVPFRKAYLRWLIDVIEVDDHQLRIKGRKDLLETAVLGSESGHDNMSTRGEPRVWAKRDRSVAPRQRQLAREMRSAPTEAERKLWWHLRHRLPTRGTFPSPSSNWPLHRRLCLSRAAHCYRGRWGSARREIGCR